MTEKSAAGELLEMIEIFHDRSAELARQLKYHPERFEEVNDGIQALIDRRSFDFSTPHVTHVSDPLDEYRGIDGLIVCGRTELDKLFRTEANPLKLKPDWIPDIRVDQLLGDWIRSLVWRDDAEWNTRAILTLVPPRVGKIPTDLCGQSQLLGVGHDGVAPGSIRQDVFYSNFLVQPNYDWARKSAASRWQAVLLYECPLWTIGEDWAAQQLAAKGLSPQ